MKQYLPLRWRRILDNVVLLVSFGVLALSPFGFHAYFQGQNTAAQVQKERSDRLSAQIAGQGQQIGWNQGRIEANKVQLDTLGNVAKSLCEVDRGVIRRIQSLSNTASARRFVQVELDEINGHAICRVAPKG